MAAFGARAGEIAAELAAHFEAARDFREAVAYATRAGDTAIARHADREAIEHFWAACASTPRRRPSRGTSPSRRRSGVQPARSGAGATSTATSIVCAPPPSTTPRSGATSP